MTTSATTLRSAMTSMLVLGLFSTAAPVSAQSTQDSKLLPADGQAGDAFGSAVATDGARIAVGSPTADASGSSSGSAYVFGAQSGSQLLQLAPLSAAPGDQFGASIALDGTRAAVGAPLADRVGADSGTVYVFDAVTGTEALELAPADGAAGLQFGYSVAMDDGLVAVGALGAAYLFDASTGQQLQKLLPVGGSTTLGLSAFGEAVDIDGGRVVVGARLENGVSGFSGAAYVYDAASGNQLHRLIATNGTVWAFFGACVSIDDDVIAIGAPEAGPKGKHSGAAYVFDADTGEQVHYLFPTDGHIFAKFGSSVAVVGQDLFIGSEQNHAGSAASAGSVYRYDAESGSQVDKLFASDAVPGDDFGGAVAAAEELLVAGAARRDDLGDSAGAAYVFGAGSPWLPLGGALSGTNGEPELAGTGSLLALQPFQLSLTQALENSAAFLVVGTSELNIPLLGGTLVPNPSPPGFVLALPTDLFGEASFQATWPAGVPSGFKLYFQFWVVDPGGPQGVSASNATVGTSP